MAYSDQTEFLRGLATSTDLSTDLVVQASGVIKVGQILIESTAADTIDFRKGDDSASYFIVRVGADQTLVIPRGMQFDEGLRISGAATSGATVNYVAD